MIDEEGPFGEVRQIYFDRGRIYVKNEGTFKKLLLRRLLRLERG